ncbi:MAG: hypothetical protein Q8M05_04345 [Rhodoferax sp.]|uniref:hypothetical protein n=1 Tax=Rhodoferax sp. TaxID=50421 RepID=UPI002730B546|nr:hypothetical protein [Rhodoferax sp.]MDP1528591.1 hypothetical protein [Rhodoferax sp.]
MSLRVGRSLAAALGALLAVGCAAPVRAAAPCAWDARLAEASTADGHRVSIIFSSFTGQQVRLRVADQPVLEKALTTSEWSAAYSGSVQCRLEGRTHFTVTISGRATSLYLDVDGPLQIYVSPSRDGTDIALHETDMDGFLLD